MTELLDFAARLIELEGGAVDASEQRLSALLPEPLATRWNVSEELVVAEHGEGAAQRLTYGSELLERMLETATRGVSIAAVRVELPPVRASQVKAAAERWTLRNGLVSVGDVRLGRATRFQLFALATLHGDEKRESIVSSVLSAVSETEVMGFAEAIAGLPAVEGSVHLLPSQSLLTVAGQACQRRALADAQAFHEGMTRRYQRDRERIEGYFEDLFLELDKRARKGKLEPGVIADKRNALLVDRTAKLEALSARFVLRIEVNPIALRAIEVDGGFVSVTLRRRKATRSVELEYDGATHRLVAPRCDSCSGAAPRPAACDDALHLLCDACAPKAEGRVACAACKSSGRDMTAPKPLSVTHTP
jgi:hypothetical protein